jgi:adenylate cyclase
MPVEIERKFLVINDGWRTGQPGTRFCQGYLASGGVTVRVRRAGRRACITVKGSTRGIVRAEYEYPIPIEEAEEMLRGLCKKPLIEKTRYQAPHQGRVWVVDVFAGQNSGLVLAEIELRTPDEDLVLPPWVGREVSHERGYRNSVLTDEPKGWHVPDQQAAA